MINRLGLHRYINGLDLTLRESKRALDAMLMIQVC